MKYTHIIFLLVFLPSNPMSLLSPSLEFAKSLLEKSFKIQQSSEFVSPLSLGARLNLLILSKKLSLPNSSINKIIQKNFILLCECTEAYVNSSYTVGNPSTKKMLSKLSINTETFNRVLKEASSTYVKTLVYIEYQSIYELSLNYLLNLRDAAMLSTSKERQEVLLNSYDAFCTVLKNEKNIISNENIKNILFEQGLINSQGTIYYIIRQAWKEYHKE